MLPLQVNRFLKRISPNYPKQREATTDNYIEIGGIRYIIGGNSSLLEYSFKLNRRGGDSGSIKFGFNESTAKSNDIVTLAFNGEPKWLGYISKLEQNNTIIHVSPLWNKLMTTVFTVPINDPTNSFFESTPYNAYDLLRYLKPFIESQGITMNLDEKYINIPRTQTCTLTVAGYTIDQILNEMEKFIPKRYVWGVGVDGVFYYKDFEVAATRNVNFLDDTFSDSKLSFDYSEIYSEYTVLLKEIVKIPNDDGEMTEVERQRPIGVVGTTESQYIPYKVGDDTLYKQKLYPPTNFTNLVGSKNFKFQIPYSMDNEAALDLAYNELRKQQVTTTCELTNINIQKWNPNVLESVNIYCFPNQGNTGVVSLSEDENSQIVLENGSGTIQWTGDFTGRSFGVGGDPRVLSLSVNDSWQFVCDRTEYCEYLKINYVSKNIITKFRIFDDYGNFQETDATGGVVTFILKGYDKRTLTLVMIDPYADDPQRADNEFAYTRVIGQFSRGVEHFSGVVREIEYKYNNGVITNKIKLSSIGSIMTGFLRKLSDKLDDISKVLQG